MVAVGDYLQVIDRQTMNNISGDILNVYYFEVTAVSGAPVINTMGAAFEFWWNDWVLSTLKPIQTTGTRHVGLTVNNLAAYETEFLELTYAVPYTGSVGVDFSSSATAWSFQLTRLFRTTRNGSKRYAGVPDSLVNDNVATAGALTLLAAHASNLEAPMTINEGEPTEIFVRMVIPRAPTPPATLPSVFNPVASVSYRGVGSQNSRKQLLS